MEKSEMILVGDAPNLEDLAGVLSCKVGSLPTTYLGLPLGAPYKSSRIWNVVEERFQKKTCFVEEMVPLKRWKTYFDKKNTLSSLPIYFISLFVIPKRATIRLEKTQKDFLWGGGALDQKPHLVNWAIMCFKKQNGGLRIRNLSIFNKALLGKWFWRFASERNPHGNQ
ncbi:putative ribonuclease H protein [Vitis vinifera]|uniref:Putative ribonuclease H protein n=1 Tax=Vitis vinifera TaxID=29760 RepID=A0A438DR48_VITVI|nr:putative ribonuclease H protein [Vitis vinifera]